MNTPIEMTMLNGQRYCLYQAPHGRWLIRDLWRPAGDDAIAEVKEDAKGGFTATPLDFFQAKYRGDLTMNGSTREQAATKFVAII